MWGGNIWISFEKYFSDLVRVIIYRRQGAFPGTPPQSTVVKASIEHNYLGLQIFLTKGGSKVRVLRQGGACNSAPKGPNDLKFCMQGAFVCYYWVLVKSRSCDLYRGQSHLEARTGLAIIEVAWTWLDQNSIVTHKSPLHAKFQVIWSIGDWVTGTPLSKNPDFAPPLFTKIVGGWGLKTKNTVCYCVKTSEIVISISMFFFLKFFSENSLLPAVNLGI